MLELDKVKGAAYDRTKIKNLNKESRDTEINKMGKEPVLFARIGKMASEKIHKCVDDFRQFWWIFG